MITRYDAWLKGDSDVAALVMRQLLEPVEGKDAVIFPPTYPVERDKAGYNIDRFDDGSSVCQLDSVGSQANRMEPIFKGERYKHLVPQVVVRAGEETIHLLEAGHRAADAIVRFSTLGPKLDEAFRGCRKGDAKPLAEIAPTSLVFGAWDSRATQVKLPRILRSVIRAYNVEVLTRSAQYSTIAGEILGDGEAEVTTTGINAELGLAHVPSVQTHGGVKVRGEIRRDAIVNLAALRALATTGEEETMRLRRYLLGLALVAITAPQGPNLREGCELVPVAGEKGRWQLVRHDGDREKHAVSHEDALAFATAVADEFGVNGEEVPGEFKPELARRVMAMSEADRKKLLRQGPVTEEAINRLKGKNKDKGKKAANQETAK